MTGQPTAPPPPALTYPPPEIAGLIKGLLLLTVGFPE